MRVLIDTSYALRGPSGTAVYLQALAPALRDAGVDVVEEANVTRRPPAGGGAGSVRNLLADRRWTRRTLPRRATAAAVDVLHHPLPAFAPRARCPQVITVHDLAFETYPARFDRRYRTWAGRAHRAAAQRADVVICVSGTTAELVENWWDIEPERVVVAHHGPGQELPVVERTQPAHVLYVGDDEPRKNLALLHAAMEQFTALPLRVAGKAGESVDAAGLAHLYAGALALVQPSIDEGFGLAPLEAMAAGVPVVAVEAEATEEVCGDAALYVDARDPTVLAAALERLHTNPALRTEMAGRGAAQAACFSWAKSARAHVDAYERALAGH